MLQLSKCSHLSICFGGAVVVCILSLCSSGRSQTEAEAPPAETHQNVLQTRPVRFKRPDTRRYRRSEPIQIKGDGNRLIEHLVFYPPAGRYAIRIDDHHQGHIIIRDCVFIGPKGAAVDGLEPGNGSGVLTWQTDHVVVEDSYFEYIQGFCVRVMGGKDQPAIGMQVRNNRFYCLQAEFDKALEWGWMADGVQFIRVGGTGNLISGNICINDPGKSYLTDFINVFCSSGTERSPLLVNNNVLIGGGAGGLYNQYGCGIQLNDHLKDSDGGSYDTASDNLLIDPGIVGMNINGGLHASMTGNKILMSKSHRTNFGTGSVKQHPSWAGMTLYNWSGGISRDRGHIVRNNSVAYREVGGTAFINKTHPPETVVESNDWSAKLDWNRLIERRLGR